MIEIREDPDLSHQRPARRSIHVFGHSLSSPLAVVLFYSRDPGTHETSHEQQRTAAGLLAAVTRRKLWRVPPIS